VSEPTVPGGADPTLPGGPGRTGSWDAPRWNDRLGTGSLPGADPTGLYPASPPTATNPAVPTIGPPVPPIPPVATSPGGRPGRPPRRGRARTAIGVVLLFVAGLAATGTVAAAWTRTQVRDEDTWAATSEALVEDPVVQQAVADQLATTVISVTGADDVIQGLLPGPLGGLAGPVTERATEVVSTAALRLVRTDAFVRAWDVAVRNSHEELLAALDGKGRYTDITSGGIELDLGSTLEQFRLLLDDNGLTFLDGVDLSGIDVSYLLIDAPGIQRLRDVMAVLDTLVVVLPVVAVGAGIVGLLVARRRSWALAAGGVGALAGVALVWVSTQVGRDRASGELSGGTLGPAAVQVVVDHVTASLTSAMGVVAVVGVIVVVLGVGAAVVTAPRG